MDIAYDRPTKTGHYGRNGPMQGHGIEVTVWGGELHLQPVVSGGRISGAARISVPLNRIDDLIKALEHQRDNP
ncbi:hypothetical protein [Methylorubrum populi]|uniref:hypothetical protein n=1 Tax=Methylorubrum populi TaxID=223967 RepID=UPI000DB266EC|nr:hypothetical protein [Methylorubrum populi]PZP71730.1 MAG: hypothetical protein DI590_05565 [Methylorubrum populi]